MNLHICTARFAEQRPIETFLTKVIPGSWSDCVANQFAKYWQREKRDYTQIFSNISFELIKQIENAAMFSGCIRQSLGFGMLILSGINESESEIAKFWQKRFNNPYWTLTPVLEIIPRPLVYYVFFPFQDTQTQTNFNLAISYGNGVATGFIRSMSNCYKQNYNCN